MSTPFLEYHDIDIPAGHTYPLAVTGSIVVVKYASAAFKLNFNGSTDLPAESGWTFQYPNFKKLTLKNLNQTPLNVKLYSGNNLCSYSPPNLIKDAPTVLVGKGLTTLAAGGTLALTGLSGIMVRRQVVITNLSAVADIQVLDSSNAIAGIVFPRSAWTMPTSSALTILNPAGNPNCDVIVGESFYI